MIVGQQTLIIDSNVAVAECPVSALFYHSGSDSLFVGDNIFVNAHGTQFHDDETTTSPTSHE